MENITENQRIWRIKWIVDISLIGDEAAYKFWTGGRKKIFIRNVVLIEQMTVFGGGTAPKYENAIS